MSNSERREMQFQQWAPAAQESAPPSMWNRDGSGFSLKRLFGSLRNGKLDGYERKVCEQYAAMRDQPFNPLRPEIPWQMLVEPTFEPAELMIGADPALSRARAISDLVRVAGYPASFGDVLKRDLTVSTPSAGGYLAGTVQHPLFALLPPWSPIRNLGVVVEDGNSASVTAGRITTGATAGWLSTEGTSAPTSQPTLGSASMTPKQLGVTLNYSRLLRLQTNVDALLSVELMRAVDAALTSAIFAGSGASGQPTGIVNTAGVNAQSGTSLAHSGVAAMKKACADNNAPETSLAFVAHQGVRQLLEVRERAAGNGMVWDGERVGGFPAYVSSAMPSATMICGPWNEVIVGVWGGLAVEINPYANFASGGEAARVILSCDIVLRDPRTFTVASSIT